jgi:hypothetical protein
MLRSNLSSKILLSLAVALLVFTAIAPFPAQAEYPKPSSYPISWELVFEHVKPKRITVQAPGDDHPVAYWYMTYHVINNTNKDRVLFYPVFELMTESGLVIRSDKDIAPAVFNSIKSLEHQLHFLQEANAIGGDLRQGEDQSKDGVAIWREPDPRMGTFSIFISGMSGESKVVKEDDKDVTLRKTLQLTYRSSADENHPGQGELAEVESQYVMR